MQLPPLLRAALDDRLAGYDLDALRSDGARLSARYRSETRDGRRHLDASGAIDAYLATRMPATFAAIAAALDACAGRQDGWAPQTLLDVGAGPGTALFAAFSVFSSLQSATMIEASGKALAAGSELTADLPVSSRWIEADARAGLDAARPAQLSTLCYVLDELSEGERNALVAALWSKTEDTMVVVEPGTPAGWRRMLDVRRQLLAAGGHIVAPCPHAFACPVEPPDWCHFAERVERSRTHRLAKEGTVPFEDEKFAYLVVTRRPLEQAGDRVLAPPSKGRGKVSLKLCRASGELERSLVTKREGEVFRQARRLDWGDRFDRSS